MWILENHDDSAGRLTFRLPAGSVKTVGRSTAADYVVDAALVSRVHCQLTPTADSLHVQDLGSTNGTFVNGRRITTAELKPGDTLSVGRTDLLVSRIA
jgi:ABC transport system ATP-binding/permease protein